MFSSRLPSELRENAVATAVAALRRRGEAPVDLTESNPTAVGISYPDSLLAALSDTQGLRYAPDPRGLLTAREAVGADAARRGAPVDPAHVVLTASTSEAYGWLFKLLCEPGDTVLVPRPSYPLFEHLTQLEAVQPRAYELEYHGRWSIDFASLADAPARTRALLVVSPNNPTGSYISSSDLARLTTLCAQREWTLIVDEVFADYPLESGGPLTDIAARATASAAPALTFTLGGASKGLGLPQVKLGWMVAGGPPALRSAALTRLELIADTYLSVSTPVQLAAARLLTDALPVRDAIQSRVMHNLVRARTLAAGFPGCELLHVEGGWSAVLRVPATRTEERLVLDLLDQEHVLVHPGYFFDFPREAYLVVSLLVAEETFADAFSRVLGCASC